MTKTPWGRGAKRSTPTAFLLASLGLVSCGPATVPVDTRFELHTPESVQAPVYRPRLRFFVSDITMIDANGAAVPVRLDPSRPWQDDRTALISLLGDRRQADVETASIHGSVAPGKYVSMEFLLGIPFDRNHGNPLHAPAPRNVSAMYWSWQSGHKFVRLDLGTSWSFHLGSLGCHSESAVRPPTRGCRRPHLARIRLPARAAQDGNVVVDLASLLAAVDPARDPNCMGRYAEREVCRRVLGELGLDPETGRCVADCAEQRVFRLPGPR